jgi:hypothetical protein
MSYQEIKEKKKPLSWLLGKTKTERYTAIGGLLSAFIMYLMFFLTKIF